MNNDFEIQLAGLRRRPLPVEWKAHILADVQSTASKPSNSIATIFMPPKWLAWGMAAAWLIIGLFNGLTSESHARSTFEPVVNSPTLGQQQQLIASLINENPDFPQ